HDKLRRTTRFRSPARSRVAEIGSFRRVATNLRTSGIRSRAKERSSASGHAGFAAKAARTIGNRDEANSAKLLAEVRAAKAAARRGAWLPTSKPLYLRPWLSDHH